jgi:nucleoside phosphorylase/predicted nucleic acid-binding protein
VSKDTPIPKSPQKSTPISDAQVTDRTPIAASPIEQTYQTAHRTPHQLQAYQILQLQRTVGNRATARFLNSVFGATVAPRPTLPQNNIIQRIEPEEYEQLLIEDQSQDRTTHQDCKPLLRTLKNVALKKEGEDQNPLIMAAANDAEEVIAILEKFTIEASAWSLNFEEMQAAIRQARQPKKNAETLAKIKNEVQDTFKNYLNIMNNLESIGIDSGEQRGKLVLLYGLKGIDTLIHKYKPGEEKPLTQEHPFITFARRTTLGTLPHIELDHLNVTTTPPSYKQVPPSQVVLESGKRTQERDDHPMDPNEYIHRHFSEATMHFLLVHQDVDIFVMDGSVSDVLAVAKMEGFTSLNRLADNPDTDFAKYTAYNSKTGKMCLMVLAASGESYRREILAHFTHYKDPLGKNRSIHPKRVILLSLNDGKSESNKNEESSSRTELEFEQALTTLGLPPIAILVLGKVDEFRSALEENSPPVSPLRLIRMVTPPLFGILYDINKQLVLSLRIEPGLYADRAGAFIRVLSKHSGRPPHLIFTGTSGAVNPALQLNDLVAPVSFAQVDELKTEFIPIENEAANLFRGYEKSFRKEENKEEQMEPIETSNVNTPIKESKKTATASTSMESTSGSETHANLVYGNDIRHGAVDSILFEDAGWKENYEKTLTVVEQEVAGILHAYGADVHNIRKFIFFSVSDVLGKDSFAGEGSRQMKQQRVKQNVLMMDALKQILQSNDLKDTGNKDEVPLGLLQLKIQGNNLTTYASMLEKGTNEIAKLTQNKQKQEETLKKLQLPSKKSTPKSQTLTKETSTEQPSTSIPTPESKIQDSINNLEQTIIQLRRRRDLATKVRTLLQLRNNLLPQIEKLLQVAHILHPKQAQVLELQIYDEIINTFWNQDEPLEKGESNKNVNINSKMEKEKEEEEPSALKEEKVMLTVLNRIVPLLQSYGILAASLLQSELSKSHK